MNELNMSIYTGKSGENKVTLTVSFESHDAAVAFHNGLADLCNRHSGTAKDGLRIIPKNNLLSWSRS